MDLFEKAQQFLTENKFFVLFRLPNETLLQGCFQKDDVTVFKGEEGFVISDFNQQNQFVFTSENSFLETEIFANYTNTSKIYNLKSSLNEKADFEFLVAKSITEIHQTNTSKIVMSRCIKGALELNNKATFKKLLNQYPKAFCYWYFLPEVGQWMGASPEVLIKSNDSNLKTVALAGTQLWENQTAWQSKEIEEQQLVTDFIIENLKKHSEKIHVSDAKTEQAGSLAHLKSTITATVNNNSTVYDIIKELHPTPAVCGLPQAESYSFIKNNEGYERSFYTGFLGLYSKLNTQLFVNLRCMQIVNNKPIIYVGCGITAESDPRKEFIETENKAQTMREILVPLL